MSILNPCSKCFYAVFEKLMFVPFKKLKWKSLQKCFCSISKVKNLFSVDDIGDFLFLGNWQLTFPPTATRLIDISFHFT